ncbi:MAG: endonuclease III [Maribacter sp.]|jgi:endonuclease III
MNHKTVYDKDFQIVDSDYEFKYQEELTKKLDADHSDFDQDRLNEIILWKVSKYARFSEEIISALNSMSTDSEGIDSEKTRSVLKMLLETKGVGLPMASTILRFRNKNAYQIIDQRVYRIINEGKILKLNNYRSKRNREQEIELYINYLNDLRKVCLKLDISFSESDRVLFMADKRINKEHQLGNYQ